MIGNEMQKDELINELKKINDTDDYSNNIRINISQQRFEDLIEILESCKMVQLNLVNEIRSKLKIVPKSNINKRIAIDSANEIRIEKSKEKIVEAIEYLRRNNKKVTQSEVSKVSGCSVNTVRKYKEELF